MAAKLSSALVNALAGVVPSVVDAGSQIALVSGTAKITDTQSRFLDEGFRPGDVIEVSNSSGGTNDGFYTITSVASDGSDMVVSPAPTDEAAAAATPTVACVSSKGFKDIFRYGVLRLYSGSQPADADAVETGTLLLEVTVSSGAFTKGTSTNGLQFGSITDGVISKNADIWSDTGIAAGTAGWYRFYDNALADGADSADEKIRFDGSVGVSGADLDLGSTTIAIGATTTIDGFDVTLPMS